MGASPTQLRSLTDRFCRCHLDYNYYFFNLSEFFTWNETGYLSLEWEWQQVSSGLQDIIIIIIIVFCLFFYSFKSFQRLYIWRLGDCKCPYVYRTLLNILADVNNAEHQNSLYGRFSFFGLSLGLVIWPT